MSNIPQSMTHKIMARASGRDQVATGDFLEADIDMCFTHDPALQIIRKYFYKEFGADARVWDPTRIALFQDHLVPAKDAGSRHLAIAMDNFAREQDISKYYPYGQNYGICHIMMCERGHVLPGQMILGTDSHSVTYGAFNAFGSGVGVEDMLNVFRTGKLWFRVPEVIEVRVEGKLPQGVMAKDIILRLLGDITMAGASGKTLEFTGSTIENLSAEERMTLCNMTVEGGAKNGIMAMNDAAREYLRKATGRDSFDEVTTDPDFEYSQKIFYQAEELTPMVAYPHRPDNTRTIAQAKSEKIKVNQVYVGSCTGAKMEDLEAFTREISGKKAAPGINLIVVPGSMRIYRELLERGMMQTLMDSGAVIESPGCKACYGAHGGVLGDEEVCLSTTNRNFKGRMGNPGSGVYLASPIVAAKTAVAGYITD